MTISYKRIFLILFFIIFISACQQLLNGQEQPVKMKSNGEFITTCGGAVENWGSCFQKAGRTCSKGYKITSQTSDNRGTYREIVFTCNK